MPGGDDIQRNLEPTAESSLRENLGPKKKKSTRKWDVSYKQVSLLQEIKALA